MSSLERVEDVKMGNYMDALKFLYTPKANEGIKKLYGKREGVLVYQLGRYRRLGKRHVELFGDDNEIYFSSAPGRTEIAGNHTDHNSGKVLAAAVNLDTVAAVSKSDDDIVTLYSEGFPQAFVVDLNDLSVREDEKETTNALIRGVAARMKELGYKIGGFNACVASSVSKGSGLSSSAAFEVMLVGIFDGLFNDFSITPKLRAQISQYAENVYFGKPSGLMDQMASSVGGLVTIDFRRAEAEVEALSYDFAEKGYSIVVVHTEGDHGNLTNEYAAIPNEMKEVARALGGKVLRDVLPEQLEEGLADLKGKVPDRAILRAMHFFDENKRVKELVKALQEDDLDKFFALIIESGESSWKLLQNIYVPSEADQGLALALEMSRRMLKGKGAWRIHGGGFAGTILTFVPNDMLDRFIKKMDGVFGDHSCTVLDIRPMGATFLRF